MGYCWSCTLLVFILTISELTQVSISAPDYTTLVYKGCARQPLSDPSPLSALFSSLLQQSSRSKYFKTTSSGSQGTITGLYQCRGDLTNADCYNCVSKLPQLSDQLCGQVASSRVQLLGCYMLYEVSGFTQISGLQMLYKVCSPTNVAGSGFEMRRDSGLTLLENGIENGNGFYTTNYQGVYVLGQCQGDLSASDCSQCVKAAVQKAQIECGGSISGQVYLHKCFISYSYYPNGVPTRSSSFSSGGYSSGGGSVGNTGKTVAIIVGVTAGVGFLIIMVLFVRGLKKKDDDF